MMEQYALKPCPFCGGAVQKMVVQRNPGDADEIGVAIRCENPECYAATVFAYAGLEAFSDLSEEDIEETVRRQAAESWNRRAEHDE